MSVTLSVDPQISPDGASAFPDTPFADTTCPGSRRKVDELFMHWLSLGSTSKLIDRLMEDVVAGRPLDLSMSFSSVSSTGVSLASALATSKQRFATPPPRSPNKSIFSYGEYAPGASAAGGAGSPAGTAPPSAHARSDCVGFAARRAPADDA